MRSLHRRRGYRTRIGRDHASRGDSPQALFAIVQGALFKALRWESADRLCGLPFDGFAIGGLAVGERKTEREDVCEFTTGLMPADKPRYLMGVGTPLDLLEAVHRGVDMFDCILPTQFAQRGGVFSSRGVLQLRRAVYKFSEEALDPVCSCPTCARYSRGYLHHLTKASEPLGWQLLGQHNLCFYLNLMRDIRESIVAGRFPELYREQRARLAEDDIDHPPVDATPRKASVLSLGRWEVHPAPGPEPFMTLRQVETGEAMHALAPVDAARRWIERAGVRDRLCGEGTGAPFVVWDVGLGAAANAMAAIRLHEELAGTEPLRPLLVVSFENDLDSLRLAIRHNKHFPYLRHPGPDAILKRGRWQSKERAGLTWVLVFGNFLETMAHAPAPPDVILYDLPSVPAHQRLWSAETFALLHALGDGQLPPLVTVPETRCCQPGFPLV